MPGEDVANFINPINAKTCCSPGIKPEDSADASLIAKSVCAGLASDTEVNWYGRRYVHAIKLSHLPKWGSSHSLPLGSGMWMPELRPRIMWRSISWPWPAVWFVSWPSHVLSSACCKRDCMLHVLLCRSGKNKEEKDLTWPCPDTELFLRLPSDAWYHNGQSSLPVAWPPPSARQSLGETGITEWVNSWVMIKTFGVTSAISHTFCSLIILCLSGVSSPFLN